MHVSANNSGTKKAGKRREACQSINEDTKAYQKAS